MHTSGFKLFLLTLENVMYHSRKRKHIMYGHPFTKILHLLSISLKFIKLNPY